MNLKLKYFMIVYNQPTHFLEEVGVLLMDEKLLLYGFTLTNFVKLDFTYIVKVGD